VQAALNVKQETLFFWHIFLQKQYRFALTAEECGRRKLAKTNRPFIVLGPKGDAIRPKFLKMCNSFFIFNNKIVFMALSKQVVYETSGY